MVCYWRWDTGALVTFSCTHVVSERVRYIIGHVHNDGEDCMGKTIIQAKDQHKCGKITITESVDKLSAIIIR